MPNEITLDQGKAGVKAATNKRLDFVINQPAIELLVGGPYKNHPYGHTALRVVTASKEVVYDYGRYGDTWGIGSSEGEGVLQIWSNFNAYIAEENSLHRLTTAYLYPVTEAKAQEVMAFFEAKIKGKKVRSSTASMKSYLIDDYYALGPNCTTLSVSAAKVAIPDIDREWATYQQGRGLGTMEKTIVSTRGWPKYIFMPADLQEMLSKSVVRKPKSVSTYGGN